jgi:hypothetical protein
VSLQVTGAATGKFRIKNSRTKLRLRAVYFTVLISEKQGGQIKMAHVKIIYMKILSIV